MTERETIEVDKEAFNSTIEELAERRTEDTIEEINRKARKAAFLSTVRILGYISTLALVFLGLYLTWDTGNPIMMVVFGGTAILTSSPD